VGVSDTAVATAFATVAHASGWLTVNILGLMCLLLMGGREWARLVGVRSNSISVVPVSPVHEE
jgi:hypothetical protein